MKITRPQLKQLIKEEICRLQEQDSREPDTGDTADTGDVDVQEYKMPVDLNWYRWSSTGGESEGYPYAILPIDEVEKIETELLNGDTVNSRLSEFRGDRWELRSLERYIFGNPMQHGYSNNGGFERNPNTGDANNLRMLPPSWTIAMSVAFEKSDEARREFNQLLDNEDTSGLKELAASHQYIGTRQDDTAGIWLLWDFLKKMNKEDPTYF